MSFVIEHLPAAVAVEEKVWPSPGPAGDISVVVFAVAVEFSNVTFGRCEMSLKVNDTYL